MFWITVLLLAALQFGLAYVATLFAGLSSNPLLTALANVLIFPSQHFPQWIQEHPILSWVAFAASCLACALLICAAVRGAHAMGGPYAAVLASGALLITLTVVVWSQANPPPNWTVTGHRYFGNHYLMLPVHFTEATADLAAHAAIHQNLYPDTPYVPDPTGRWYWNYASTSSGFPRYDAVVIATPTSAAPTRAAFLALVTQQRAQGWTTQLWTPVADSGRWIVESALPDLAPISANERNQLLRIVAKEPANGAWLALVGYQRKLPQELAIAMLDRALESVSPMSGTPQASVIVEAATSTAVAEFRIGEPRIDGSPPDRPDWIAPEVWSRHRFRSTLELSGTGPSLHGLALRSDDGTRINLFLHNTGPEPIQVLVHAPDGEWKQTAMAQFVAQEAGSGSAWTLTPLLPLSMPRALDLSAGEVQLMQLTELSPASIKTAAEPR